MAESQTIEWKASWQDEYIKWICGFANTQGGRLRVGLNDGGIIVGGNLRRAQTPEPAIACEKPGFWTVFDYQQVTPHDGVHDEQISTTGRKIIRSLAVPAATPEILAQLGYAQRPRNYKVALFKLISGGYIEMTIPEKPRSRKQKYRLTTKGRETLRKLSDTESPAE